jgi:Tfp pilus assembly protein PilV
VAPTGPPVHLPTSPPHHLRPSRGFALIDVITAAILLGVALAVVIGLISRAISSQKLGEDLQVAAMLADEQLNLVLARGPDEYSKQFPTDGACDAPFERFSYALDINGGSDSSPYTVAVTIRWPGGPSRDGRSITIETLMASRLGDDPDPDRLPVEPIQRY